MSKCIAITGCSRGIGLALVKQYLLHTEHVVYAGTRNKADSLEALQASDTSYKTRLHIQEGQDMKHPVQAAQDLVQALNGKHIDVLVHNAGVYLNKGKDLLEGLDESVMAENIFVNTVAPLVMTRHLLASFAPRATIAAISSQLGSISQAHIQDYSYSISKAGLNMGLKILSQELKDKGIRVCAISPGWVKTDMGGMNAPMDLQKSVEYVQKVIDSGIRGGPVFLSFSGREVPW